MRVIHLLFAATLFPAAQAQFHGDVWQFGFDTGLRFDACSVEVITGANEGFEGCSAVTGHGGELQFYTNGDRVWNRMDVEMPNGFIGASGSLSQVLIVQQPGSANLYHIITPTIQGQVAGALAYHTVDMNAGGGYGDVVSMDNTLYTGVSTEHVAATWHANGTDVWIMAHAYPSNEFLAYLLTPAGINTAPVVSAVGLGFPACNSNINARGELRFTLDGSRLAMAGNGVGNEQGSDVLALYQFDNATGVVSAPLLLPPARGDFGLAFSPDGTKLYGGTWKALNFFSTDHNELYQYDLSSGDPQTIAASRTTLYTSVISDAFGSLKLGPDGRIYVARYGSGHLGVINFPDEPAATCGYVHDGLYLNGATSAQGLNNYIDYVYCTPVVTDVRHMPAEQVRVGLDPAGQRLVVQGGVAAPYRIMDVRGMVVAAGRVTDGSIGVAQLATGTYVVELGGDDAFRTRFVVP